MSNGISTHVITYGIFVRCLEHELRKKNEKKNRLDKEHEITFSLQKSLLFRMEISFIIFFQAF